MTNKNVTCIRHDNNDVQRIPRHDDVIVEISTRLKSPIPSEKLKSRKKITIKIDHSTLSYLYRGLMIWACRVC